LIYTQILSALLLYVQGKVAPKSYDHSKSRLNQHKINHNIFPTTPSGLKFGRHHPSTLSYPMNSNFVEKSANLVL